MGRIDVSTSPLFVHYIIHLPVLTFFRTNQLFSSIFLIFYVLLLRFSVFMAPFKWSPSGEGVLSGLLYQWIGSQTLPAHILAILLLVAQGFLINSIVIGNRLSNEVNLFPGVFYVLTCCLLPDFLYLSPVLIGNTFILISIAQLFSTYKISSCADRIFNVGFWIGVASLFYVPFIFCFILMNAGLNILRAYNLKERLIVIIGLVMPFFLVGLYYFAMDDYGFFWENHFGKNFSFLSFGGDVSGWDGYIKILLFLVLIFYVVMNNRTYLAKRNIQAQKKISILYWVLISGLFGAAFQKNLAFEHLISFAPALGVFLAFTFTNLKRQWAESIHFLMFLTALALQLIPWQL